MQIQIRKPCPKCEGTGKQPEPPELITGLVTSSYMDWMCGAYCTGENCKDGYIYEWLECEIEYPVAVPYGSKILIIKENGNRNP